MRLHHLRKGLDVCDIRLRGDSARTWKRKASVDCKAWYRCLISSVLSVDRPDLRQCLSQLLPVLLARLEAELLLSLVREEQAQAGVCHDADTNENAGFRREGFIPPGNTLDESIRGRRYVRTARWPFWARARGWWRRMGKLGKYDEPPTAKADSSPPATTTGRDVKPMHEKTNAKRATVSFHAFTVSPVATSIRKVMAA
jgi:hypothetical protein